MAGFGKEYQMMFALNGQLNSGFTTSFSKASATVTKMQNQIAELNAQQGQISSYEKQQSAIEKTRSKLELLQKQYDNIQKELDETGGKSSDLQNKLLSKQAQIDKTSTSLQQQTDKLNQMGAAMSEAGIDTSNLTAESQRLDGEMEALKKSEEEAAEQAKELGNGTVDSINAISSALAAAGIIEGFKQLGEAYGECLQVSGSFESAMSQVAATMGTTSGSVQNLSEYAKEMGATTSFTAVEAAEGLNILAMAGLNANEQMETLPTVLDLAAAGGMTMAQAAGYVTTTVKGFSDEMGNASYYADLMAKGATMANTNVSQLGEALATSGATAANYSQSADSVTLSLLRLAEQGETGSAAGTMLNRAMADLYTPTSSASAALDALGFSAYDSSGKAKDFNDVIEELSGKLDGMTEAEKNATLNTVFTTNGLQAFNKMTVSTTEKVDQFKSGLASATGSTAKQAKTQLDNMNGSYTIMQSALEGVQISMGELWQDEMTGFYKAAGDILTEVNEFIKQNPGLLKAITGGAAALATLTTGVVAFNTAMSLAGPITTLLGASIGGLPLLGVAAGIAGVVAVGGALYDAFTADDRAAADLSQSASALQDTIDGANSTFDDSIGTIEATANAADKYIDKLEELESAGLDSESAQKEYHNTLELLVQTVPELADCIDLENDAIEGGIASIRERTKAWEADAKAQAYQQKMTEIYSAQADVMIEAEKNSIKLTKAKQDMEAADKAHSKAVEEYNQKINEYNERIANCKETGENYVAIKEEMEQYEFEHQQAILDTANALDEAERAYSIAQQACENDAEAVAAAQDEIDLATEAYENLTSGVSENADAMEGNKNTVDDFNSTISGTQSQLEALTEAYTNAYNSAYDSISGQWDLWDQAAESSTTSIQTINDNLESQQQYWETYNDNLNTLQENVDRFEGLGDVLSSFVDGSEESAAAVSGIADAINKGNDADVQKLIDNYKSLQEEQKNVSESVADLQTEYTQQIGQLVKTAETEVKKLDLSDEARSSATKTVSSYINAVSGSTGRVTAAYQAIYNAALAGLRTSGGGSTTSKKKGYATGTDSAERGFKLVGENGPELMYFNGGEKVYTADETKSILSRSDVEAKSKSDVTTQTFSPSVNISFNVSGSDAASDLKQYADDFAEKVLDVLQANSADLARRAFT